MDIERRFVERSGELSRAYPTWRNETIARRTIGDVLVEVLTGIELEVDITAEELTKLDVQVLEHIATSLMGKIPGKPG
jgi:hypothetical protein